jgi:hypothetical protein
MQDGCKVYMDSYITLNGSCSVVTWTNLKTHLLEVGLTQNQDTMALRALTTVDLFYFIMREDPTFIEIHRNMRRVEVYFESCEKLLGLRSNFF